MKPQVLVAEFWFTGAHAFLEEAKGREQVEAVWRGVDVNIQCQWDLEALPLSWWVSAQLLIKAHSRNPYK